MTATAAKPKPRSLSELKAAISKQWKSVPAGAAAVKIIGAIEAQQTPEPNWSTGSILGLLGTQTFTPEAVGALAILTQSEFAIFSTGGDFVDEVGKRHQLSGEDFQRVLSLDTLQHPVTGAVVANASERVVTFFVLDANFLG